MNILRFALMIIAATAVTCFAKEKYRPADEVADLAVSFVDDVWDGAVVPMEGICGLCGDEGAGMSPSLLVENIPENADALVVEFNDRDFPPLAKKGGHGALRIPVSGRKKVVIPSVKEQTKELPDGVFVERMHRAPKGKAGAYLAPCSCGMGNRYFADVLAVAKDPAGGFTLLGKARIELGKY